MMIKAMVMILSSAKKDSSVPNPLKDGFFFGSYRNQLAFDSIPQRMDCMNKPVITFVIGLRSSNDDLGDMMIVGKLAHRPQSVSVRPSLTLP
jgi:hypothetical protein